MGADAIRRLNGMFAFVFHDRETNEWIAARDHFRVKPLYTILEDELLFGSEIKHFGNILQFKRNVMSRHYINI